MQAPEVLIAQPLRALSWEILMSTLGIEFSIALLAALLSPPTFAQNQQTTPPPPPPAQLAPKTVPDQVQLFIPYKQYSHEDNQRILKLYEPLRVSDVSDGMDVIGLQDIGIADEAIQPLWRDTQNFTHRIVGIAVTARYVPTEQASSEDPPRRGRKLVRQHYRRTLYGRPVSGMRAGDRCGG